MYELTCPSCEKISRSSFVRIGAVVDCARCGERYTVAARNVTRHGKGGPVAAGGADPLLTQQQPKRNQADRGTDPQGNVIGLSGLSNLMKSDVQATSPTRRREGEMPAAAPAPNRASEPSGDSAARASRRRAQRRRRFRVQRSTYLLVGALFGMIFALGLMIFWANQQSNVGPTVADSVEPADEIDAGLTDSGSSESSQGSSMIQDASVAASSDGPNAVDALPEESVGQRGADPPLLETLPLRATPWTLIEPPERRNPAVASELRISRVRQETDSVDGSLLIANLTNDTNVLIERAEIALLLVNQESQVVARAVHPMMWAPPSQSMQISAAIPATLADRGLRVAAEPMQGIETQPAARILSDAQIMPLEQSGLSNQLRLRVPLGDDPIESELVFLITAADDRNSPVQQWHARSTEPVASGEAVEFRVQPEVDEAMQVTSWSVLAIGINRSQSTTDTQRASATTEESAETETSSANGGLSPPLVPELLDQVRSLQFGPFRLMPPEPAPDTEPSITLSPSNSSATAETGPDRDTPSPTGERSE